MDPDDGTLPETALKSDGTGHGRRPEPADLDIRAETDAEKATLPAGLRLLSAELLIVDDLEGAVKGCRVVSAVVGQAAGHRSREAGRRDEVAPSDLGRSHPEFCRQDI